MTVGVSMPTGHLSQGCTGDPRGRPSSFARFLQGDQGRRNCAGGGHAVRVPVDGVIELRDCAVFDTRSDPEQHTSSQQTIERDLT
jgi:hypothetical protein